jgi:hypothetical protein
MKAPQLSVPQVLYLVVSAVCFLLGIGIPVTTYWSVSIMFAAVSGLDMNPVPFATFSSIVLSSLQLCFQSLFFCSSGIFCIMRYLDSRKKCVDSSSDTVSKEKS